MKSQAGSDFLVIDGNSLLYRAFYALPLMQNERGQQTNAIYGFTNMLYKLLEDEPPEYIAVVFDPPKPSFRARIDPSYKANREKTPSELVEQINSVREILKAMNIAVYVVDDYEADDVIGTLADRAASSSLAVKVITGDTDLLQLVGESVFVILTRKGISQMEVFDLQHLKEHMGLTPLQVIDYKALKGDPSDNIPGVPGIGEKTALNLISEFKTIEGIYENIDTLKGKTAENLGLYRDQLLTGRELVTLQRNVPLHFNLSDCRFIEPDYELLLSLFQDLGFRKLSGRVKSAVSGNPVNVDSDYETKEIKSPDELCNLLSAVSEQTEFSLLIEKEKANPYWKGAISQLAFSSDQKCGYYLCSEMIRDNEALIWKSIAAVAKNSSLVITNDIKYFYHQLMVHNLQMEGNFFDLQIGSYLINPTSGKYDIDRLLLQYLGVSKDDFCHGIDYNPEATWLSFCATKIFAIKDALYATLKERQLEKLFWELELPLACILAEMEKAGITIRVEYLEELSQEINVSITETEQKIYDLAGEKFNLNSPRQLGEILFDKLKLPALRKTKTGRSTDARVLEELSAEHEIASLLLHYRQLTKLAGTYLTGLINHIDLDTGKLHTTFNHLATATGRLSSSDPNLQNIPIRLAEGRKIRRSFIPSQDKTLFLAADYSQVELRILAHLSQDPILMEAFQKGEDVHQRTAAEVNNLSPDEVTAMMREKAKAVNFGIIYGSSDYGLAQGLKIPRAEAKKYIDSYFERYSGVKKYMDEIIKKAREQGYVTTLLNRRRYLPDINSSQHNLRSFAERMALNTPIQGSAADIIKLAMIKISNVLKDGGFRATMLLQIHDELLFEVEESELDFFAPLVKREMEEALTISVPLQVDLKWGKNWEELKKLD